MFKDGSIIFHLNGNALLVAVSKFLRRLEVVDFHNNS